MSSNQQESIDTKNNNDDNKANSNDNNSKNNGNNGNNANNSNNTEKNLHKFRVSDRIYCRSGDMIYEARVLKLRIKDGQPEYYVHYHGWNKNWDEWVGNERALEMNDDNKNLYLESTKNKEKDTGSSSSSRKSTSSSSMSNKRSNSSNATSSSLAASAAAATTAGSSSTSSSTSSALSSTSTANDHHRSSNASEVQRKSSSKSSLNSSSLNSATGSGTPSANSGTLSSINDSVNDNDRSSSSSQRRRRKRTLRSTYAEDDYKKIHENVVQFTLSKKLKELLVEDYVQNKLSGKTIRLQSLKKTAKNLLDDYLSDRREQQQDSITKKFNEIDPPIMFPSNSFPLSSSSASNTTGHNNNLIENLGPNATKSLYEEYVRNLCLYFNTVAPTQLLYPNERLNYATVINESMNPSSATNNNNEDQSKDENETTTNQQYSTSKMRSRKNSDTNSMKNNGKNSNTKTLLTKSGSKDDNQLPQQPNGKELIEQLSPVHLIRLFVRLGSYLQYYNCDKNMLRIINIFAEDFFDFCENNYEQYFASDNVEYYSNDSMNNNGKQSSTTIAPTTTVKRRRMEHELLLSSSPLINNIDHSSNEHKSTDRDDHSHQEINNNHQSVNMNSIKVEN